jgi:polar amino acid transport system substrate-binding protein
VVNAANFNPGDNWEDYNRPEVKVSVAMGTTDEAAARKFMPKATLRAMKGMGETILDVQSGNAQTLVTTLLVGMGAMQANPNLAKIVVPKPLNAAPSGGGTRKDGEGRFTAFLQGWSWAYRESGRSQKVIFDAMQKLGLDVSRLPTDLQF